MNSIDNTTNTVSEHREAVTIEDFFQLFGGEVHDLIDFEIRLEEAQRRFGKSEILNDIFTWIADTKRLYLWENFPSIYSLLGSRQFGSLPHSRSSIFGALKRAEALITLTKGVYRNNMIDYLERQAKDSGRGIFDANGEPIGFALADFALHRMKLIPLHKLVLSGKAPLEPDWEKFFDMGFEEYKHYCFMKTTDRSGLSRSSSKPPVGAYKPGILPGEGVAPTAEQRDPSDEGTAQTLERLDPFANNNPPTMLEETGCPQIQASRPVRLSLPKFSSGPLPVGSLPRLDWLFVQGNSDTNNDSDSTNDADGVT